MTGTPFATILADLEAEKLNVQKLAELLKDKYGIAAPMADDTADDTAPPVKPVTL